MAAPGANPADLAGRRTRLTHPDSTYFDYDWPVSGDISKIRENGATSGVGVLATYNYDTSTNAGQLGQVTSIGFGNGASRSFSYDAVLRLTSLGHDLSGTTYDQTLGFSYNPASQITQNTRSNDLYAWGGHYNFNRSYTSNGLNQYTASGSTTPTYDTKGNLTSAGSTTYAYSSENLLKTASGGITLAYDPAMRLYETAGSTTTRFAYDGADLVAEHNGSNTLQRRFVHGPGVDDPIVWYEGSGTSDRRFLQTDERGSVTTVTNSSGGVIATNAYDEYGIPASTNLGRFQYTGQTWLPELGMYYYKARIYSPTLGRFLQTDPIGYGDGMNMYAYVGGDPVNGTDPSGTMCYFVTYAHFEAPQGPDGKPSGPWEFKYFFTAKEGDTCGSDVGAGGGEAFTGMGGPLEIQPPCPPTESQEYPSREDAHVAAVQRGRYDQIRAGDQNERSYYSIETPRGTHQFRMYLVGDEQNVPIPIKGNGSGHIHTSFGGDRLSSATNSSGTKISEPRDVENITSGLERMGKRGTDTSKYLTTLGAENGSVRAWYGKKLKGKGKKIGTDQCRRR